MVDDDLDICELLRAALELRGHDVRARHDGAAALAAVEESAPDLIVLDWMMPVLQGPNVCAALRMHDGLRRIPIIMLTARSQPADEVHGFTVGADDYLVKPFSPRALAERVDGHLELARLLA